MKEILGRPRVLAGVALAVCLLASGCAWRKALQRDIAGVNGRVTAVEGASAESARRIRDHDVRLATIGSILTQQESRFKALDEKIEDVRLSLKGKLLYKEILRNADVRFGFDSAELTPAARQALDAVVARLVSENRGIYIEVQGHTDSSGPDAWNRALGRMRAEAVTHYLYTQYRIPLHRLGAVSMGSAVPIADNARRAGRAQNRRVEVLVLE